MIKLSIKTIKNNPSDDETSYIIIDNYNKKGKIKRPHRTHYIFAFKLNKMGKGILYTSKPNILSNELYTRGLPMFDDDIPYNPTLENYLFLSKMLKICGLRFNRKKGVFIKNGKEINNKRLI